MNGLKSLLVFKLGKLTALEGTNGSDEGVKVDSVAKFASCMFSVMKNF